MTATFLDHEYTADSQARYVDAKSIVRTLGLGRKAVGPSGSRFEFDIVLEPSTNTAPFLAHYARFKNTAFDIPVPQ